MVAVEAVLAELEAALGILGLTEVQEKRVYALAFDKASDLIVLGEQSWQAHQEHQWHSVHLVCSGPNAILEMTSLE